MHGVTGCSERSDARKQNAPIAFGPWLRSPSLKKMHGGNFGQMPKRKEPFQCGYGGGFGCREQGRTSRWG